MNHLIVDDCICIKLFDHRVDMLDALQVMEGLENLKELQQLWLGRNRIQTVNLCGLTSLLKISLQSNRLTSMAAFQVSTCFKFSKYSLLLA